MSYTAVRNIAKTKQFTPDKTHYSIVIPAAGMGYRTKTYGNKSLIRLTEQETLIQRQLRILQSIFNSTIIVVSGFEANMLMNHLPANVISVENNQYETTNVSRSIGMGLRAAQQYNVLLVYGDLVFSQSVLNTHLQNESVIFTNSYMHTKEVGCTFNTENVLENIEYGLPTKWAQIVFFTGKELELLKKLTWNPANDTLLGYEIINKIIAHGGIFKQHASTGIVIDIDTPEDIKTLTTLVF